VSDTSILEAMRRRRLLLGFVPCLPLLALPGACAPTNDGPVSIGLVLRAPAGLLAQATAVKLSVFDAAKAKCLPTGHASAIPAGAQSFALQNSGCAKGVAWCKQIALDEDGSSKMFAVVASNAAGTLAEGCATAAINQDPLEVDIKVQRYLPPACCGDGKLEPGEQCDSGTASGGDCPGITADAVCSVACTSIEIPLDRTPTDKPPAAGTKAELALAFCPGAPDKHLQNGLRAVFTDTSATATGGSDVAIRDLDQGLYPLSDPSLILPRPHPIPMLCSDPKSTKGSVNAQSSPAIAPVGADVVAVAYVSDELAQTQRDIFASAQGVDGCADTPPVRVSTTSGASAPDVAAGPPNMGLVVWVRDGQVFGRFVARTTTNDAPPKITLTPQAQAEFSIAPNGTVARVAGAAGGWVVVYEGAGDGDGDGIFARTVAPGGVVGPEVRVNVVADGKQDQPDVAMLGDGRHVVVWRGADHAIWFQRFDKTGAPAAHDQDAPLNTVTDGERAMPAVASSGGLGDFYAVAWEGPNGTIGARFVGGDQGFGYNSVSGQNDEFEASSPEVQGDRHRPAVAVGGGGFVAIGWQDASATHSGVYVRRFPLPL
jgi:hypothetical protein